MRALTTAAFAAALGASPALALEKPSGSPQQMTADEKRTAACTKQAGDNGLKGRERSQFMTGCLRAGQPKAK